MSISTLESPATRRAMEAQHHEEDEFAAQVNSLRESLLADAAQCQADKFALFAPRVKDRQNGGTRLQTVGEIVREQLEYRDFGDRAIEVLLKAAAGRGTQREAQQLLAEMAAFWADMEAGS